MNTTHYAHLPFRFALGLCAALPLAASALTVGNLSDGSLSGNTLTVTADVSGVAANATATLWIGQATPRDGDPANLLASVASTQYTADSHVEFNTPILLGAKIAFKIVVTEGDTQAESVVKTIIAYDNFGYTYTGTGVGNWHDPANWNDGNTGDGVPCVGYPAYSKNWINMGSGTKEVHVDAAYVGFNEFHVTASGLNLTMVGDSDDAEIHPNNFFTGANTTIVYDHLRLHGNNYRINDGSSVSLINGTYFSVQWWFYVTGQNATLSIGPGCRLRASVGDGYFWYGTELSGQNATIIINDGLLETPRLRIGTTSTAAPKGLQFLGTSPKMECKTEFLVVEPNLSGSPTVEFVVPSGGYATAPIRKITNDTDNGVFAGHTVLNWQTEIHGAPPILFKINEYSPFFSGSLVDDVLLVDWSNNGGCSAGINTDATDCGVDYAAFEDPDHNSFYTDSNVDGVAATRVWAHLTGTGEPASKTLVNSTASESVSGSALTVNASLLDYDGGNGTSTATLYVGYTGPAGDPTTNMAAVASTTLANGNAFTFSADVVLGSKTAYAVVVENTQGKWHYVSSTSTNIVQVRDSAQYVWVNNNSGLWSDPANWTCTVNDNKARLGYPSYGNSVRWLGNQTAVVEVDAAYTGLADVFVDNPGLNLTLIGTVDGASVHFGNTHCTANTRITLDNVLSSSSGGASVGDNGSFTLLHGSTFSTAWEFKVEGANALLHVGDGSSLTVATSGDGQPYRLGLYGENARIEIDNSTVSVRSLRINYDADKVAPYGIVFSGTNPVLRASNRLQIIRAASDGGRPTFLFSVPANGYVAAPIQRNGSGYKFLDTTYSANIPATLFQINRHSPFFNESKTADVQLVSWPSQGIDTAGVEFDTSVPGSRFYYMPAEDSKKTDIYVQLQGHGHTVVLFR